MNVGLIMLAVPFVAMLIVVRHASLQPVCLSSEQQPSQNCVACSNYMINGTRWDNTGVLQTISEMVARDDRTTEGFAAASAMAVIGIAFVVEQVCQVTRNAAVATALRASVFVGAGGMIGLTVWSLRVNGLLHSTFTALTIVAMLEQLIMCAVVLKSSWLWAAVVVAPPAVALTGYMHMYSTATWPDAANVNCKDYFDEENFGHAKAQCAFVVLYFIEMAIISDRAEGRSTRARPGQGWKHVRDREV